MLWIALHLPQLPLDIVLRCRYASEQLAQLPLAVSDHKRIGWCNTAALDAGIRAGMSEGNARALNAQLEIVPRTPPEEIRALHEAALWSLHFTPHVTLRGCGLLAEVAASLRLFNGADNIAHRLLQGIRQLGLHGNLAMASTATAAWLLAQCPSQKTFHDEQHALDCLPVHVLTHAQPWLDTLHGIGCHTLGQLRQLPRAGITRRFGKLLLTEIDRAYGKETEAHAWFEAPTIFQARLELISRVEHAESLLFAARRLVLQLTGWLAARHAVVSGITLWMHHESSRRRDHQRTPLTIVLGMASRDPEHLTLLLRERLARLTLHAPVIELSLHADQIAQQAAPNTELFATSASQAESSSRLIERLQNRLGKDAVKQLAPWGDHRPEYSNVASSVFNVSPQQQNRSRRQPLSAATRPSWLLSQPLPLRTRQHKPVYHSPLLLLTGPERIEAGWWDDALATRDYFIAENEQHLLLWIFRTRIGKEDDGPRWFLHGLFG
ncbi:MAG: DNA polymerase Y family protein [Oxalicibacterium faecigallinarum]|uniref:Y-family DNA polymerase n=1 Tax=Oxalicibacterium faecigallinarum TaxID=573741 RepID=UPI002807898C|nr:DNA polymerase Y family protein [Oxalicibacterium faecigallinarum]MDQ7968145.1 DNA polymerase Y family protein [Oxalicibacterium faecigallinarum]